MAKAKAAILAEPRGLNVATVTELRRKCREAKVEYRIVKNSLAIRAAKGTDLEQLAGKFVGPTALVMSYDDVVAPAKLLADFVKDRENFTLRIAVVQGKVIDVKGIMALAKLPLAPRAALEDRGNHRPAGVEARAAARRTWPAACPGPRRAQGTAGEEGFLTVREPARATARAWTRGA